MPAELTLDEFEKFLGDKFVVTVEDCDIEFELVEATCLEKADPHRDQKFREPFSLLFKGPQERPIAQQVVPIKHAELGELTLFIVPIGSGSGGMNYEVIFN